MAIIQVKFDNTLEQSPIVMPLLYSSIDEAGETYEHNQFEMQQSSIHGARYPLVSVNNIVIDLGDILYFDLKCTDVTPSVKLTLFDKADLIKMIDTPGVDNQLRVQILPKFEGKYKKINLTFYITKVSIRGQYITISGEYKSPKFTSANIKAFGQINTYKLFEKVAKDTQLGFATNIEESDLDNRFIYCDNKSYKSLLAKEIKKSGEDLQVLDYWIDWWNNLVLVDVYERYNTIDKDEDMLVWVTGQSDEVTEGSQPVPELVTANLNNSVVYESSELYVKNYSILNSSGAQYFNGSDQLYSTYEINKSDYSDYLVMDGDVQKDITTKFEYLGEVYGDYNYLLAGKKRESFLQKMQTNETIEVTLKEPTLGIMRGNKVNFTWFTNDTANKNNVKTAAEAGIIQDPKTVNTNIPIDGNKEELESKEDQFEVDKSISGQYLVTGCNILFADNRWEYKVILKRPMSDKPKIMN